MLDPNVVFEIVHPDGTNAPGKSPLARVRGNARALLSAERVALNFVGRMSGIATLTRQFVDAVAGTKAIIIDTRKTTPNLRAFEKYAVRCGGGMNHRVGLFDAVLIKDNHIVVAGGIGPAIVAVKSRVGHLVKVQVEVDTLDQLKEALQHKIDAVLLDNMTPDQMREAVKLCARTRHHGGVRRRQARQRRGHRRCRRRPDLLGLADPFGHRPRHRPGLRDRLITG